MKGKCRNCHALFTPRVGGSPQVYCSPDCRRAYENGIDRTAYYRAYYQANKSRYRERTNRWRRANPGWVAQDRAKHRDRTLAHTAVNNAVRRSKLVRPGRCEQCTTRGPVQAHHPDYSHPLDVVWLCVQCHTAQHRKVKT